MDRTLLKSMFLEGDPSVASLRAIQRKFNISNASIAPFPPQRSEDLFDEENIEQLVNG